MKLKSGSAFRVRLITALAFVATVVLFLAICSRGKHAIGCCS